MKIEKQNIYTKQQKYEWFGGGIWNAEPDFVEFDHEGFKCRIVRVVAADGPDQIFGGNLTGYVRIPPTHLWHNKDYDKIECECHQGLTFSGNRWEKEAEFWIGFDCGHTSDIIPSMQKYFGKREWSMNHLNPTYKDINYCIEECKKIVEQAKTVKTKSTHKYNTINAWCPKCNHSFQVIWI